jgi:hypothetical protein
VAVDEGLTQGRSALSLSKTYALGERAIGRHKAAHLSPALTAVASQREEKRAVGLVERLENAMVEVEEALRGAKAEGARGQLLAAVRELRACIELQAKLTGEMQAQPQTTVNILASPEIARLITVLLRALEPFPEAKIAAAEALDVMDDIKVAS